MPTTEKKSQPIHVIMGQDLHRKFKQEAQRQGVTMRSMLEKWVTEWVEDQPQE